jgi:hypothetical protein
MLSAALPANSSRVGFSLFSTTGSSLKKDTRLQDKQTQQHDVMSERPRERREYTGICRAQPTAGALLLLHIHLLSCRWPAVWKHFRVRRSPIQSTHLVWHVLSSSLSGRPAAGGSPALAPSAGCCSGSPNRPGMLLISQIMHGRHTSSPVSCDQSDRVWQRARDVLALVPPTRLLAAYH